MKREPSILCFYSPEMSFLSVCYFSNIWVIFCFVSFKSWLNKMKRFKHLRIIDHIIFFFRTGVISIRHGSQVVMGHIWRFKFSFLILIQKQWPITRWSLATTKMLFKEFRNGTCTSYSELTMTLSGHDGPACLLQLVPWSLSYTFLCHRKLGPDLSPLKLVSCVFQADI